MCLFIILHLIALSASVTAITPPTPVAGPKPTSCDNYQTMGYKQSGFFLVQNGESTMETIYCDYSKTPSAAGTLLFKSFYVCNNIAVLKQFCIKNRIPNCHRLRRYSNPFIRLFLCSEAINLRHHQHRRPLRSHRHPVKHRRSYEHINWCLHCPDKWPLFLQL